MNRIGVLAARFAGIDVNYVEVKVDDRTLKELRAGSSESRVKLDSRLIQKIINQQ